MVQTVAHLGREGGSHPTPAECVGVVLQHSLRGSVALPYLRSYIDVSWVWPQIIALKGDAVCPRAIGVRSSAVIQRCFCLCNS